MHVISDSVPKKMRVVVVAATGVVREELKASFDEDFEVASAPGARAAEEAAAVPVHSLVVVADDLPNDRAEDVIQRVRLASAGTTRVTVTWLTARGESPDVLTAFHAGADDVARWPMDPEIFRARVRSLVRVASLEASMERASALRSVGTAEVQQALSQATHMVNNAVAAISGRAQLVAITGTMDDQGLVPVCLVEARKISQVLNALHRLVSTLEGADEDDAHDHDMPGELVGSRSGR